MRKNSVKTIYRSMPTMPLMHNQVGKLSEGSTRRFGFIRLVATQWHRAATLLIDLDRAVNDGWPNLRSPSCPEVKRIWTLGRNHSTAVRRLAGSKK